MSGSTRLSSLPVLQDLPLGTNVLDAGSSETYPTGDEPGSERPPPWLRVRANGAGKSLDLERMLKKRRLHTVCSSAACPNLGECWGSGTATFMILGNECTRACRFCDVKTNARPKPIDLDEPQRLVEAAMLMELKHVVITSVTRDDAPDGGAAIFAACIEGLKKANPNITVEVLTPDFQGQNAPLYAVLDAGCEVFNHNLETIERLQRTIRSGAKYDRSLRFLQEAKRHRPDVITKSGMMLGLGETDEELRQGIRDLREHDVDNLTLGQYLRPSRWHHEVVRYAHPDLFLELKEFAEELGFAYVESGPLVRSSYHAERGLTS
ncbi:MAG: lipoyl synthase [Deltaproteobacteria bacterium]|nr:lipoyl synthase [Deltaproteobacteria bacterium]